MNRAIEGNIKINLKEKALEGVGWIHLAQCPCNILSYFIVLF
jgi:hypothetical protein